MGFGRPLVVHDTPENRETAGKAALYADVARPGDPHARRSRRCSTTPSAAASSARRPVRRARDLYRWDAVTDAYEKALSGA